MIIYYIYCYNKSFIYGYWTNDNIDLYLNENNTGYIIIREEDKILENNKITFEVSKFLNKYTITSKETETITGTLNVNKGTLTLSNDEILIKDNISLNSIRDNQS